MKASAAIVSLLMFVIAGWCQNTGGGDLDLYKSQVEQNPRSSIAHFKLGEIYLQRNDLVAAANEFREALNGDLQPPWIKLLSHSNLSRIFRMTGQHELAERELQLAGRLAFDTEVQLPKESVQPPAPIEQREAEYTSEARVAELEGTASLDVMVGDDGTPRDISVTKSPGLGLGEKAVEAVRAWRFQPATSDGRPVAALTTVYVEFRLPTKQSRWHLLHAEFSPVEGAVRPMFLEAGYPPGPGVSGRAIDQAQLLGAIGRLGTATLSFVVDEHGAPAEFAVEKASDPLWADQAIALARGWRFAPGMKGEVAVPVVGSIDLVWGPRTLSSSSLRWARNQLAVQRSEEPPPWSSQHVSGFRRITVDESDQAAKLVSKVTPEYPRILKGTGVGGSVHFNVLIGTDGRVIDVHAVSGHPMLVASAAAAAKQWIYQSTVVNGNSVEVTTEIDVEFAK